MLTHSSQNPARLFLFFDNVTAKLLGLCSKALNSLLVITSKCVFKFFFLDRLKKMVICFLVRGFWEVVSWPLKISYAEVVQQRPSIA